MNFEEFKTHFNIKKNKGDICKVICPAHADKEASLQIKYDRQTGRILVHCYAGCKPEEIVQAAGLKMSDLFEKKLSKNNYNKNYNIEAVYKYIAANGNLLFEKVRFKGKKFTQRRIINGATIWGLDEGLYYETFLGSNNYSKKKRDNVTVQKFPKCEPVLYNLPNLIEGIKHNKPVFIVEGEKDVDNVNRLGFIATCNFDGASKSSQKPKWRKEYNKYFKGARVIIIPDNDDPGKAHANNIANSLNGLVESIKILEIDGLPEKGDISDWLKMGHTKEELQEIIQNTKEWICDTEQNDLDLIPVKFKTKFLIYTDKKTTVMPIMENIVSILKHYNYQVKYNEIIRKVYVYENDIMMNELGDDSIYKIKDKCTIHHLNIASTELKSQLYRIGINNSVNPVKDYLLKCQRKWDGNSKLQELYDTLQCDDISEKFKVKYVRKMLITAVNLILNIGIANTEGVLVLAGDQGIGKTRWFKRLVPKEFTSNEKELYYLEGKELDLRKKDSLIESTASWFTELGELSSTFKKSEVDDLKNFITRPSDRFRAPYGMAAKDYRRRTIFVATVNDKEFLNDDTGSRRWWVINCKSINYNHNVDIDAIWGEAVYLWETGKETNYFTVDEQREMQEYNERYESLDNTTLLIMSCFNFKNEIRYWMKASDVFDIIGRPNNFNTKKLGIALKKLKLNAKIKHGTRYYAMPSTKDENIDMRQFEKVNY